MSGASDDIFNTFLEQKPLNEWNRRSKRERKKEKKTNSIYTRRSNGVGIELLFVVQYSHARSKIEIKTMHWFKFILLKLLRRRCFSLLHSSHFVFQFFFLCISFVCLFAAFAHSVSFSFHFDLASSIRWVDGSEAEKGKSNAKTKRKTSTHTKTRWK